MLKKRGNHALDITIFFSRMLEFITGHNENTTIFKPGIYFSLK
ncbi:MAG: hypothetical protein ACTSVI_08475 [Promethearchaeota archaeon]